jgi:hypothetical protein
VEQSGNLLREVGTSTGQRNWYLHMKVDQFEKNPNPLATFGAGQASPQPRESRQSYERIPHSQIGNHDIT